MKTYAKKAKILGPIFLTAAILAAMGFVGGIIAFSKDPDTVAGWMFLCFFISIACLITYFVKFFWFGHTFKLLKKSGLEYYLDDIDLTTPTFTRAKIYCGEKAFFCKRTGAVVAYEQFAWIYSIGGNLDEYVIRLKSGKKAYIMINNGELHSLLNNYVAPHVSKIIEGKTVEAKKEFLQRYPEAAFTLDKGKVIGGAILSAFALFAMIFGVINDTLEIGNWIIIGILELIGLGLLLYGLKNAYVVFNAAAVHQRLTQSVFVNTLCKSGSVLGLASMVLLIVSGLLEIEFLFIPFLIGYSVGMFFLFGSLILRTGFFAKPVQTFSVDLPNEMLDDTSLIDDVSWIEKDGLFLYHFSLADQYDWDFIRNSVDHLVSTDLKSESFILSVQDQNEYTDITKAYLKGKKTRTTPPEWETEHSEVKIVGKSDTLKSVVGVVFHNRTPDLLVTLPLKNQKIATAYAETLLRRSFGTADQLKLARPAPVREPASIGEGQSIHIDTRAFVRYLVSNPGRPMYECSGAVPLNEKEPILCLYEDGVKTREYCLQTEGDEDFTGKYFLISVRLSMHGNPSVPAVQIDGFISDTPEDRQMTLKDIGYRFEVHFLAYGGNTTKRRREMNRGQDLPMKALKYQGYTTPSNIRLLGVCPDCGKSFCFHGYAFYMAQRDVAYSDDGLDCCEICAYDIDKETWTYETDGKIFRYYNSFNCPHCGAPYIDYKKHPENKVFGVSGCVLLGRKPYQDK